MSEPGRIDAVAILLVLSAALLVGVVALATSMGVAQQPMMGDHGMIGGGSAGFPLSNLIVAFVAGVLVALLLSLAFLRVRGSAAAFPVPPAPSLPSPPSSPETASAVHRTEAIVVRMLGDDERLVYTKIREAGGQMLQKDLVAAGGFSKSKVTRVLDRLERRGLVVRERHGMTNRLRLTPPG